MIHSSKLRSIEVKQGDTWVPCERGLAQVEPGETFRMFEPDGTPVYDSDYTCEWVLDRSQYVEVSSRDQA